MTNLAKTLWFGYYQKGNEQQDIPWLRALAWTAFLAALFILRLHLPFTQHEAGTMHLRIIESLLAGQDWGRQALVGSIEFPPLPTLSLFLTRAISSVIPLSGLQLLVTVAEIWSLYFLIRIPQTLTGRVTIAAIVATLVFFNDFIRATILAADPAWISIVPLACITYYIFEWCRHDSLRGLVIIGSTTAVTAFAGPLCFIAGLLVCLGVSIRVSLLKHRQHPHYIQGAHLLLWAPLCYAVVLVFLGNWLILNDPVFFLRAPFAAFSAGLQDSILPLISEVPVQTPLVVISACLVLIVSFKKRIAAPVIIIAVTLLTVLISHFLFINTNIYSPAASALIIALSLSALITPFAHADFCAERKRKIFALVIVVATITAGIVQKTPNDLPQVSLALPNAPSQEQVLKAVDRHTPESRIFIHGIKAAAAYPDLEERRFIRRLDFKEEHLRWYAEQEEYLYFLLPPANGVFYPRANDVRTDVYYRGREWLFLEKVWPGGWQLWRIL